MTNYSLKWASKLSLQHALERKWEHFGQKYHELEQAGTVGSRSIFHILESLDKTVKQLCLRKE